MACTLTPSPGHSAIIYSLSDDIRFCNTLAKPTVPLGNELRTHYTKASFFKRNTAANRKIVRVL